MKHCGETLCTVYLGLHNFSTIFGKPKLVQLSPVQKSLCVCLAMRGLILIQSGFDCVWETIILKRLMASVNVLGSRKQSIFKAGKKHGHFETVSRKEV